MRVLKLITMWDQSQTNWGLYILVPNGKEANSTLNNLSPLPTHQMPAIPFLPLLLVCLLCLHIVSCGSNARFDKYITLFDKIYKDINEYNYRLQIYNANLLQIAQHNSNPDITYDLGNSIYSDLTDEEYIRIVLTAGGKYLQDYNSVPLTTTGKPLTGASTLVPVPKGAKNLDWRQKNLVASVKNQGICGNGYIFGAVAAVEGAVMTQTPILKVTYSEQQVADCCKSTSGLNCNGCSGGSIPAVLSYIAASGISTSKDYPYFSKDGKAQKCTVGCALDKIADSPPYNRIPPLNLSALHSQLSRKPVSVLVDATNWAQYKGGVFKNCSDSSTTSNHAALLVGYDSDGNWVLKNSWGEQWGDKGFITLASGNTCGLSNYAVVFNSNVTM